MDVKGPDFAPSLSSAPVARCTPSLTPHSQWRSLAPGLLGGVSRLASA